MRSLLFVVLVGCNVVEPPAELPECDAEVDEPISLPEQCYEDLDACPQDVADAPWEAACGRGYMCEIEQPDGSFPYVCVRARDCDCLEEWASCGYDVPIPGYCALQKQ